MARGTPGALIFENCTNSKLIDQESEIVLVRKREREREREGEKKVL